MECLRCENCMTLNPIGQRKCSICGYGLSDSNKATLTYIPIQDPEIRIKAEEEISINDVSSVVSSTSREKTYLRCTNCMSLNNEGQKRCIFCGSNLSYLHKVTISFTPSSVGKLKTGHSGKESKTAESFRGGGHVPREDNAKTNGLSHYQIAGILLIFWIVEVVALLILPIHISVFTKVSISIISFIDFYVLGQVYAYIDYNVTGNRNKLKWWTAALSIIFIIDLLLWRYVFPP